MRIKHTSGAASIVHEGAAYEPDEAGFFRIPFDLAQTLLAQPGWEAEPAEVYVPEPVEEPETELTPAQKAAQTRAANKAAAEADAENN